MNKARKILDWVLVVGIVVLSVGVFLHRDKIEALGGLGYGGLFLLCYLSNCTVFLPAPSLMVVMGFAQAMPPLLVATVGALGTGLGELTGYAFGHATQSLSGRFKTIMDKLSRRISNDYALVFLLALLPLPLFDFAGVYAGGSRQNLLKFFLACFAGKWLKMLFYATVVAKALEYLLTFL